MYICLCVLFKRDFKAWNNETWPVRAKHCLGTWFLDHSLILNTYVYKTPSLQPLSRVFRYTRLFLYRFPAAHSLPSDTYYLDPLPGAPSLPWLLHGSFSQHKYCFIAEQAALTEAHEEV